MHSAVLSQPSCRLSLRHGQRSSVQDLARSRVTTRRSKSSTVAALRSEGSTHPTDLKEIVTNDWKYISEAGGKIVNAMNPVEREMEELQLKMEALQTELSTAHAEVHRSEGLVDRTLEELRELENVVARFQSAADAAASTPSPTKTETDTSTAAPETVVRQGSKEAWKNNGLRSTLKIEDSLKNFWYPIQFTSKMKDNELEPIELFGETWVLFRDAEGKAAFIRDECAHRACPLSLGTLNEGRVTCAYHGWEFNGKGMCEKMPSTKMCKGVGVRALPVVEQDGLVYVWTGEGQEPDIDVPDLRPPEGYTIHSEIVMDVPVEHGLLVENLLDLAHAPFTHTSTFARGWPIPESVKFHLEEKLAGHWDPYPIDMSFLPPVITFSKIGLNQPGKIERGMQCDDCQKHLHQIHVNLPAREGHTRLLYRMSLDFIGWMKHVPGIQMIWKEVARQVLGEDLRLVLGQQDRMKRGGNTWGFPVPYDKLAVRYRRWRNQLGKMSAKEKTAEIKMNAGELFMEDAPEEQQQVASMVVEEAPAKGAKLMA